MEAPIHRSRARAEGLRQPGALPIHQCLGLERVWGAVSLVPSRLPFTTGLSIAEVGLMGQYTTCHGPY